MSNILKAHISGLTGYERVQNFTLFFVLNSHYARMSGPHDTLPCVLNVMVNKRGGNFTNYSGSLQKRAQKLKWVNVRDGLTFYIQT